MELLSLFVTFLNNILRFKIFNFKLIDYMIAFLLLIFVFKIIQIIGNAEISSKMKKNTKEEEKHG